MADTRSLLRTDTSVLICTCIGKQKIRNCLNWYNVDFILCSQFSTDIKDQSNDRCLAIIMIRICNFYGPQYYMKHLQSIILHYITPLSSHTACVSVSLFPTVNSKRLWYFKQRKITNQAGELAVSCLKILYTVLHSTSVHTLGKYMHAETWGQYFLLNNAKLLGVMQVCIYNFCRTARAPNLCIELFSSPAEVGVEIAFPLMLLKKSTSAFRVTFFYYYLYSPSFPQYIKRQHADIELNAQWISVIFYTHSRVQVYIVW